MWWWIIGILFIILVLLFMIVAGTRREDYIDLLEQEKAIDEWKKKKGMK